jgi:hypothetical protein
MSSPHLFKKNRVFIAAMNMMSSNLQEVAGSGMRRLIKINEKTKNII